MIKRFCDRCGNEIKVAYIRLWIGITRDDGIELCEPCTDALYRFMGMNTGGGYEKLDSEIESKGKQDDDE